ncbi:protein kinase [Spirillospora sp. NPDC047279]|uniref:serine/threonine-protein kinase n=1 Tax=Spirillospora sp. NPDC047279 TaxID=3155478 RepID=UPI0033DF58D4
MPNDTTGERLLAGRYRLVTQVGRGGMGTVWQAHDEVLGRDVAVKEVILPHGLTDEERSVQYKRTFREARTAARLGHPGVVTVYDVVEEDGRPWIIMELIHARSLDQVIKQEGPLEPRRAAEIGRQMLAALHAAHDAGVLHRDVKPSNVLVTRGDRAILTDFGIATATGDATLTQTGLVMGSPAYIAPERARGRTAGPASDLWSLGVTLYAMVEGRSPFERAEPMAALVAIISDEPDPAANAGRLAPVIDGLLAKNPDQRMDAIEAGRLLDEIVRRETIDTQRTLAVEVDLEDLMAGAATATPGYAEPEARADDYRQEYRQGYEQDYEREDEHAYDGAETVQDEPEPPAADARTRVTPAPARPAASTPAEEVRGVHLPPATEPVGRPPAAGGARSPALPLSRNALIVVGVVAVVLVAIVGFALANTGDDGKPKGAPPSTPATSRQSTPASPSPSASSPAPGALPAGFRLHKDPTGFHIAVPKDWSGAKKRSSSPSSVFFEAPDGVSSIQVDQTDDPSSSALKDWQDYAPSAEGRFPGYKEIKIAPVTDGEPISDRTGKKAADWEWTYERGGRRMHALNRGFVMNGTGYAIVLYAPDKDWSKTFADLAPVYSHFTPDDD